MADEVVAKALAAHGIGSGTPPKSADLWERFKSSKHTAEGKITIANRFYTGCDAATLDWSKPVHGIFVDFKGDSMQLGMLIERLETRDEQYIFVAGSSPSFNGGWHFSAVNDFEHPKEQRKVNATWVNIRIWTRVCYVCSLAPDGSPALTPVESGHANSQRSETVSSNCRLSHLYFTGGLMPHTLNATAIKDGSPMSQVITKHWELKSTFAAVGHGLDVLIACGSEDKPLTAGLESAVFPGQSALLEMSFMRETSSAVGTCSSPQGSSLITAACWSQDAVEHWFALLGLDATATSASATSRTTLISAKSTMETVFSMDFEGFLGPTCCFAPPDAKGPRIAVFVDNVVDPVEVFTIVDQLMENGLAFQLISSSSPSVPGDAQKVVFSETVFGNPMYPLRDCVCKIPTIAANLVPADAEFDSFFVAGGQCPYHLKGDPAIIKIMDQAEIAAAVCHGPEALSGSKWLRSSGAHFTAYTGCWISFRDVLNRFEKKPPGETCQDGQLFSGNAPNSTKEMTKHAMAAIFKHRRVVKM